MDDKSESEDKGMPIISRFQMLKFQYCYFLIQYLENVLIGWSGLNSTKFVIGFILFWVVLFCSGFFGFVRFSFNWFSLVGLCRF